MPASWDADTDVKFLMVIIALTKPSINDKDVAESMGEGFTVHALHSRFSRLKNRAQMATNITQGPSDAPNTSSQPGPSKRKRATHSQGVKTEKEETKVKKEEDEAIKKGDG